MCCKKISIKECCLTFLVVFFIFFFSIESFALTAISVNTIKGDSPRFINSIEKNIEAGEEFSYFGVSYNGKSYFDKTDLNVALGGDISSKTPEQLGLSVAFKQPTDAEVYDINGDGPIALIENKTNSVSLDWYYQDVNKNEIKLTTAQTKTIFSTLLKSGIYPYIKVSGPIALTQRFGDPRVQTYPDSQIAVTKVPYRNFNIAIGGESIKYASPEMLYSAGGYTYNDKTVFDPTLYNGYLPQNNYLNNFPTTGANGLYFYIVTDGIDNSLDTTKWFVKTSNSNDSSPSAITATITKSQAPGIAGFKPYDKKNMVLVTLKGPDASSKTAIDQATAPTAQLPVDIELVGITKQDVLLSYKFRITKWFINRGTTTNQPSIQKAWCEGLGNYQQASARDLSNAGFISLGDNSNPNNNYKRAVHEGLITEWGVLASFTGANFFNATYGWTSTVSPRNGNYMYVNMNDAALNDDRNANDLVGENFYALCVSK